MNKVAFSSWNGKIIDGRKGGAPKASQGAAINCPTPEGAAALMGWNGLVVNDPKADVASLTLNYLKEIRKISCGECSVCMNGIDRLLAIFENIISGVGKKADLSEMADIVKQVAVNSKCGFGQSALFPVLDAVKYYKADFLSLIAGEKALEKKNYGTAVTAPCMEACPATLDIPGYVELIKNNQFSNSLNLIRQNCILPGVVGRVCTHPCEEACVRKDLDEPIAIRLLKRVAADVDLEKGASVLENSKPDQGKKVAVIGAGPAGLAAAYNLRKLGYGVTVFESLPHAGGMAAVGIPDYRLPGNILAHEVDLIKRIGVEIKLNAKMEKVNYNELKKQGYDAVFVAVGAHKGKPMGVEGEESGYKGFVDGVEFLRNLNLGQKVESYKKAVVIGGGDVALDCARSCKRVGFESVEIIYRRSRAEMPANIEEIEGAEQEGIKIRFLAAPSRIVAKDGAVTALECIKMKLGKPDESGRKRPVPVEGSEFTVKTNVIISAIGQQPELPISSGKGNIAVTEWGTIKADPKTLMTDVEGVFAGGDCVSGPATLIEALNAGNKVAQAIDSYLRNTPLEEKLSFEGVDLKAQRGRGFIVNVPSEKVCFLDPKERIADFAEVEGGFTADEALKEAQRCLRCYRVVVWEQGA